MASPSSAAGMSDMEPPSSPPGGVEKSFMTQYTEDEDTKMLDAATPDPTEKAPRGKKGSQSSQGAQSLIGKIRHLKKEDGEPLWRKDIQYDFLRAVFDDEADVFTNSYEPDRIGKQTFADLYIDAMSRSSKTSKVLRDKLLSDRDAAKGMAMVCLLVNIGRMNTTLNFFPEMRAQLRTYHAIPSLQAHQDAHAYKQLQDAPRLKSILKGGAEDRPEPQALDAVKYANVPRTNPVNLLFVVCQAAAKIAELHFPPGQEFHDLVMKTNYTSQSRARAFLWIMWFYLESDFTEEGCEENPFGPGVDYGVDVANQGVPELDEMDPADEAKENVDTQEEIDFGYAKQKMRAKIIEADQAYLADSQTKRGSRARVIAGGGGGGGGDEGSPTAAILPRIRPSKHESDLDSTRSTPPPRALGGRHAAGLGGSSRRGGAFLKYQIFEPSSPGGPQVAEGGVLPRKPRPPTAHQLAVERNRSQRVEYILDRGNRKRHRRARRLRRADGAVIRALKRVKELADPFDDSEGEDHAAANRQQLLLGAGHHLFAGQNGGGGGGGGGSGGGPPGANGKSSSSFPFRERGFGGLCLLKDEMDDFGEEVTAYSAALRRATRRLARWEDYEGPGELGVVAPVKPPRPSNGVDGGEKDPNETEEEMLDDDEPEPEPELLRLPPRPSARRRGGAGGGATGRGRRSTGGGGARAAKGRAAKGARASSVGTPGTAADVTMDDAEDLDDVEKELLGMASGGEEGDDGPEKDVADADVDVDVDVDDEEPEPEADPEPEQDLDDVEKGLLGMGDADSDSD